jgi:hypothetical protein
MNNYEFIDFEYDNLNNLDSLKRLFYAIKNSDINLVNEIVSNLPQCVIDFFNFSVSQKDWSLDTVNASKFLAVGIDNFHPNQL